MKLQKQVAYKYKDKTHYKYVIVLPEEIIHQLNWREGQDLEIRVDESKLVVDFKKEID